MTNNEKGTKTCSLSPLAFRPVEQMVHFTNHKLLFCGWRETKIFMWVLYSVAYIVAHTSLAMLAWMFGRGLNTSMFGSDSNCISG